MVSNLARYGFKLAGCVCVLTGVCYPVTLDRQYPPLAIDINHESSSNWSAFNSTYSFNIGRILASNSSEIVTTTKWFYRNYQKHWHISEYS